MNTLDRGRPEEIQEFTTVVLRPFAQVQLDFHKVDAASIIILTNAYGEELEVPLSRWHIGLMADEYSHAVIGVYIALEINPSSDSVLEVVESALSPHVDGNDPIPSTFLVNGRVLPNQLLPELAYNGFGSLKMDNAWSNTAIASVNNVIDTVGCSINFGPVRAWWRRSLIERIFGELTRKGLQRLPSTYGVSPLDTRKDDPNRQAERFRIMLSDLTQIIFQCVREYNETPSEGLQFTSPIRVLENALSRPASGYLPQVLPKETQNNPRLLKQIYECTVHGNIEKHIRPYIQADRCRYTNDYLAHSYHLVGKKVVLYVNRRDCSDASGTVMDTGEELGTLTAERRWAIHKLSVRDRKLINSSGLSNRLMDERDDLVSTWAKEKKRRLVEGKKNARGRRSSSSNALLVARLSTSPVDTAQEIPSPSKTIFPTHPDPFGISELPSVRPKKERIVK